jgi:hypothetical protein
LNKDAKLSRSKIKDFVAMNATTMDRALQEMRTIASGLTFALGGHESSSTRSQSSTDSEEKMESAGRWNREEIRLESSEEPPARKSPAGRTPLSSSQVIGTLQQLRVSAATTSEILDSGTALPSPSTIVREMVRETVMERQASHQLTKDFLPPSVPVPISEDSSRKSPEIESF